MRALAIAVVAAVVLTAPATASASQDPDWMAYVGGWVGHYHDPATGELAGAVYVCDGGTMGAITTGWWRK